MKSLLPLLKAINLNKKDLEVDEIDDKLFEFIINSGLATYFNYSTQQSKKTNKSINHNSLYSAELTAKFITNIQLQALQKILSSLNNEISEVILLKGISLCQAYYPSPHFRIMSDIDILVLEKDTDTLNSTLNNIGYIQKSEYSNKFYESHHHSMPYYNKNNNVWIEAHTHLFSKESSVINDKVFNLENIRQNTLQINSNEYAGKVKHISPELQLIYICNHWAEDFNIQKSGIQFIDMILLLKNNGTGLDWQQIINWLEDTASASNVYIALSYLNNRGIFVLPDTFLSSLVLKYSNMSYINCQLLYKLIDCYLLGEQRFNRVLTEDNARIIWRTLIQPSSSLVNLLNLPWNIVFPPKETNRYKIHFLFNRLKNMMKTPN